MELNSNKFNSNQLRFNKKNKKIIRKKEYIYKNLKNNEKKNMFIKI